MSMRAHIESKLEAAFTPALLEVVDESANHSRGQQTHFRVTLVSAGFSGQRLLARHRQVNTLLADELKGGVHALAIHTYTPEEWAVRLGTPASPECAHGH